MRPHPLRSEMSRLSVSPEGHGRYVLVRSDDPLDDGVSDLVVDQPVLGTADEELVLTESRVGENQWIKGPNPLPAGSWDRPYLDVDVVFALGDDLDVGVVDGLLVVLDASRPIGCRTQHLLHAREGGTLPWRFCKQCDRADDTTPDIYESSIKKSCLRAETHCYCSALVEFRWKLESGKVRERDWFQYWLDELRRKGSGVNSLPAKSSEEKPSRA